MGLSVRAHICRLYNNSVFSIYFRVEINLVHPVDLKWRFVYNYWEQVKTENPVVNTDWTRVIPTVSQLKFSQLIVQRENSTEINLSYHNVIDFFLMKIIIHYPPAVPRILNVCAILGYCWGTWCKPEIKTRYWTSHQIGKPSCSWNLKMASFFKIDKT